MSKRSGRFRCWLAMMLLLVPAAAMAMPGVRQTARRVDRLLAKEVFTAETKLAPLVGDAVFLRRAWLDIVGDIPTPEHIVAFVLDPAPDKRERVVRELLADPQYGQNWARYWRDVILSRRLEDRASIVAGSLVADLTERLNENKSWDQIAAEFITASGDARDNGATAIIIAQDGRAEETTAEVSRIFLGIQIQCCQCHDHPHDRWKREQFHELAAFFPRIAVRPVVTPTRRTLEVIAEDRRDGPPRPQAAGRRPEAEHYMPDLDNPAAPGTRMQPRFFLTSAELPFGVRDVQRRDTVAEWITGNPWFATALVNRLWAELVGEGFYEPIDDIGPDRTASAPQTIEFLSRQFADSGYNVKWLLRVICSTEAYQRESRPRRDVDGTPFAANVVQPLRSDQLFNALLSTLDIQETANAFNRGGGSAKPMGPYGQVATARTVFDAAFGYDPSDPRESITSTIPQALAMMNGLQINRAARALEGETVLARLLVEIPDDQALIEELYLRTVSREPNENELDTALQFCRSTKSRTAVFEDLFWALINSSEFSHRR